MQLLYGEEIEHLGHIITKDGIKVDPKKVEAMNKFVRPVTLKKLQSFVGLCNYYRRFIPKYSEISAPLSDVGKQKTAKKNPDIYVDACLQSKYPDARVYDPVEHAGKVLCWTNAAEHAFSQVKKVLCECKSLAFPDNNQGYQIYTDASDIAIGGALQQDGAPIAFFSKKLDSAQRNYMV